MKELAFTSIVLYFFAPFFISCSDNSKDDKDEMTLIEETYPPNPMEAYVPLFSDNASSMKSVLGYGLDVMGEIGSYQSVKAQIIDVDKMQADDTQSFIRIGGFASYSEDLYGENRKEYLKQLPSSFLDSNTMEQEELKGKILFTKGLDKYDFLSDAKSEYSYRSVHNYYLRYRYYYNALTAKRYVKQSFLNDLSTLSTTEIIEKYGTHVIAEFYDGTRFDLLYMAKIVPIRYSYKGEIITVENNKREAVKVGYYKAMQESMVGSMNMESIPEKTQTLLKANINPILYLNAIGGDRSVLNRGFFNLEKMYPNSHMSEWYKTISDIHNDELFRMVKIRQLTPIYELIKDSEKREELKKAVLNYIQ